MWIKIDNSLKRNIINAFTLGSFLRVSYEREPENIELSIVVGIKQEHELFTFLKLYVEPHSTIGTDWASDDNTGVWEASDYEQHAYPGEAGQMVIEKWQND